MLKGNLSREQAIALVGTDAVSAVKGTNCEPTCRVGYNGSCQGDSLTEWSAGVSAVDADGEEVTLMAYYYTTNEQDECIDTVNWEIEGYEVV